MDKEREQSLLELQQKCGIHVPDLALLNMALTHPTYAFEHQHEAATHNQRLEFLGDAVLGLVVAEYLYHHYPEKPEGELTKMRAAVVCEATLARKATEIQLGSYLLLGKGEEMTGGRERPSILADAFEALIGAIFLASGLSASRQFILRRFKNDLETAARGKYRDYKTLLQELVQEKHNENVTYVILEESGPDHDKRFVAGVSFQQQILAKGTGKSKKEAEQNAAGQALQKLNKGEIF